MAIIEKSIYKDMHKFVQSSVVIHPQIGGVYVTNSCIFATNSFVALSVDIVTDVTEGNVVFIPHDILKAQGAGIVSAYDDHIFSNGARVDLPKQEFDVKEQYARMRDVIDAFMLEKSDGVFPKINPSFLSDVLAFIAKHDTEARKGVNIYHTEQPHRPVYVTTQFFHACVMPMNK